MCSLDAAANFGHQRALTGVGFGNLARFSPIGSSTSVKGSPMLLRRFFQVSTALLTTSFLIGCRGISNAPAPSASDMPAVTMVVPQTNGVGTNREVAVVF